MKLRGALFLSFALGVIPARAAEPAPVELPPMLVEETKETQRWLYVRDSGTEYLSRCSAATTRRYVEAWQRQHQLLRELVPEQFLARMDAPAVMVLCPQDAKQPVSEEIQRMLRTEGGTRHGFAPNMRLNDYDTHATFVYIDEARFDDSTLIVAPSHLHLLLERRLPILPAWFTEGIERTYPDADFVRAPVTLGPLVWADRWTTAELRRDREGARALMPAGEFFAPDALRGEANRHPKRIETMLSQVVLFFRWAVDSGRPTREALWRFAARAAEEPVTEEMFESCFGFGFSELRDRLSDYLGRAVQEAPRIDFGKLPALPRVEVRPATPNEIARLRGEWERLAIGHVQRLVPQVRELYVEQARRTLRRAFERGDRDPRLLATMALCEIDAGNDDGAREFLEPAVAAGVVRPRAYFELARLRSLALRRNQPLNRLFTYAELATIFDPLRQVMRQSPAIPQAHMLFAESWVRCSGAPAAEDWAILAQGARLFARWPSVSVQMAVAYMRHGRLAEARALLAAGEDYVADDTTRERYAALRAMLAARPGR